MPHNPEKDRKRAQKTRGQLLDAGKEAMLGGRVSEVSVREVVGRAKVSVGTFYSHFPDLDTFRREVILQTIEQIRAKTRQLRGLEQAGVILDPVERVRGIYELFFRFLEENREEALLLLRLLSQHGAHAKEVEAQLGRITQDLAVDIERAKLIGLVRPEIQPELAASAINAMGLHLGRLYLNQTPSTRCDRERLRQQMIETLVELSLHGVLSDAAKPRPASR